ncbi:hypothetical protein OJF2_44540 [Aquisphaera giovannonii]|uniref:Translocation protein TolB n=1 Tax=Aquisphaera giovannonii TaxID=406548 RepID=A0A5B9W6E0_9BACT|nr:hypothetical protein [Aquisphaera giovannonii]QEH35897.1 hypothetical protein OJF2_44540 [Aquisphaera giovannonii]
MWGPLSVFGLRACLWASILITVACVCLHPRRPSARLVEVPTREVPILVSPPTRDSPRPTLWVQGDPGRTTSLPAPAGKLLDLGVCSPWREESGRFQVVGRLSGGPRGAQPAGVGLARVSYPDGEVLDFVDTGAVPTGRPCWFPGTSPRVLFAAGDGCLYHHRFAGDHGTTGEDGGGAIAPAAGGPRRIEWRCPLAAQSAPRVVDSAWLGEDRGGLLLAVVTGRPVPGRGDGPAGDELWWLRLDEAGDAVVEAGPLIETPPAEWGRYLRSPIVGRPPGGDPSLAYLAADSPRDGEWELRWAPLRFDDSGRPRTIGPGARLASGCSTDLPPAFSADVRSLRVLQGRDGGRHFSERALPDPVASRPRDASGTVGAAPHPVPDLRVAGRGERSNQPPSAAHRGW